MSPWKRLSRSFENLQSKYEHFEQIDSTNVYLMNKKIQNGRIARANFQTKGKGRQGRTWEGSQNESLLFSIALTEQLEQLPFYIYTFLAANSIVESIQRFIKANKISVKLPNDILVDGQKICGILLETRVNRGELKKVVIGIGLNINQNKQFFQNKNLNKSTSLSIQTGKKYNLAEIFEVVLSKIDKKITTAFEKGFEPILKEWREYCSSLGQKITIETNEEIKAGIFMDISDTGSILLETEQGIEKIKTGDVILNKEVN